MNKTFISCEEGNLFAAFDLRFGRCPYYCILNQDNGEVNFHENTFKHSAEDAGLNLGNHLIKQGVDQVISGDFGKKTHSFLMQQNVQMLIPGAVEDISQLVTQIKSTMK